jgi:hypothetical protein
MQKHPRKLFQGIQFNILLDFDIFYFNLLLIYLFKSEMIFYLLAFFSVFIFLIYILLINFLFNIL